MRGMWIVAVAVLAGCAQTPAQVRELDAGTRVALKGDYRSAGNCVHRQLEYTSGAHNVVLWRDDQRAAEVIGKQNALTFWVVDIEERAGRTEGIVRVSDYVSGYGRELMGPAGVRTKLAESLLPCR